jgi:hypothetical protein
MAMKKTTLNILAVCIIAVLLLCSFGTGNMSALLDSTPNSDHDLQGLTTTLTAGTNLTFGQYCYVGSDGKMELADADSSGTMPALFMALGTITENASGLFTCPGVIVRDDTWEWATLGALLYIDTTTAGGMTDTAPSGSGDQVQVCGVVLTADIVCIFQCPILIEVS